MVSVVLAERTVAWDGNCWFVPVRHDRLCRLLWSRNFVYCKGSYGLIAMSMILKPPEKLLM